MTPTRSQVEITVENLQSRAWLTRYTDWSETDIARFLHDFKVPDDLNACWVWQGSHIAECPVLWLQGRNNSISLRLFISMMAAGVPYAQRDSHTTRRKRDTCAQVACCNPMHRQLFEKPGGPSRSRKTSKPKAATTKKKQRLPTLEQWNKDAIEYLSQV